MLGRVVYLNPFGQTPCFRRSKGFVERSNRMRVKVVADQNDLFSLLIPAVHKAGKLLGPIHSGSLQTNPGITPALKRFSKQKLHLYCPPTMTA